MICLYELPDFRYILYIFDKMQGNVLYEKGREVNAS